MLEDLTGVARRGIPRARSSRSRSESLWALDVLVEEGFRYDSSIFPSSTTGTAYPAPAATPGRSRRHRARRCSRSRSRPAALPGFNVPMSGGGYFRLYPYALTRAMVRQLHRERSAARLLRAPVGVRRRSPAHPRCRGGSPEFTHYHNLALDGAEDAAAAARLPVHDAARCLRRRDRGAAT